MPGGLGGHFIDICDICDIYTILGKVTVTKLATFFSCVPL
jgi:hypothetical protein